MDEIREVIYEVKMMVPEGLEEFTDKVIKAKTDSAQLLVDKQYDYGPGNISKTGEYGVVVRLNDKIERLLTLYNKGTNPKNESIDDTWMDVSNYGTIGLMLRNGDWPMR